MDDEIVITRAPKSQYLKSNGFNAVSHDEPITDRNLGDALDRHRVALHTAETKGRAIPSFQDMQQISERIETPATVQERIQELQDDHLEDLRELYSYHSADYTNDFRDFYMSMDDTQYLEEDERNSQVIASHECFEELHIQQQRCLLLNSPLLRELNEVRHAYLTRLLELQTQRQELQKRDVTAKRLQMAQFPQSTQEFNSSSRETQTRVANFLLAEKPAQEQMMDEYGWAWRAAQPLIDECKKNVSDLNLPQTPPQ